MIFRKKVKKTEGERLEDRREKVLARANKFRYPMQFSRKRVMIVTILISLVAVFAVGGVLAWNLYHGQNTGDMMFRLTKILPVPVAKVDGDSVRFSDYLLIYRSSLVPIVRHGGQVGKNADAETMRTYYKRSALTGAEDFTYAEKLARELKITISREDLMKEWEKQRSVGGVMRSEASFLKVLKDNFDLEKEEYLRIVYLNLLKTRVMERIDDKVREVLTKVEALMAAKGGDLKAVADEMKDEVSYEETGGFVSNVNVDGGRAAVASGLTVGQVSEKFLSTNGDGYYFVKLNDKNEKEVNYSSIVIKFKEFDKRMAEVRAKEKGVVEFVKL